MDIPLTFGSVAGFFGQLALALVALLIYLVLNPKLLSYVWEMLIAPLVHLIPKGPARVVVQRLLIFAGVFLLIWGLKQGGIELDFVNVLSTVFPTVFGDVPASGDLSALATSVLTSVLMMAWHKKPLPIIGK